MMQQDMARLDRPARKHQPWDARRHARLTELWEQGAPARDIAEQLATSAGAIYLQANKLGLPRRGRRGRQPGAAPKLPATDMSGQRRFTGVEPGKGPRINLKPWHPALRNGATIFGQLVEPALEAENLLRSGQWNRKIGGVAAKGRWKGMPIYTLTLEERATCPRSCQEWATCFAPGTRVLTMDMDWVPVEDLHLGQRIAGFDEDRLDTGHRQTRVATVEAIRTIKQPCFRVVTTKGEAVVSAGHLWLSKREEVGRRGFVWRQTADLRPGDKFPFLCAPWVQDMSYDAGRLRGFVEGEGTCGTSGNNGFAKPRLAWSQQRGELQKEINEVARRLGFDFRERNVRSGINGADMILTDIVGGWRAVLDFLGRIKPSRLMAKAEDIWACHSVAGRGSDHAIVQSIEYVGEREVVAVKTSTNTMVAEGFFTHNCYGNNMGRAPRLLDDGWLKPRLFIQLTHLSRQHPNGFIVRLHVLGDFYSLEYVRFWADALKVFPALHIFGFTARQPSTDIGAAVLFMMQDNLDRVAMRVSGGGLALHCSEVVDRAEDATGIVCPAELDPDRCCATCGLCWQSERTISFVRH